MKVSLSFHTEVRLVTLRWLRRKHWDDANYVFVFGHSLWCRLTRKSQRTFETRLEGRVKGWEMKSVVWEPLESLRVNYMYFILSNLLYTFIPFDLAYCRIQFENSSMNQICVVLKMVPDISSWEAGNKIGE